MIESDLRKWPAGMVIDWHVATIEGRLTRDVVEALYVVATRSWMNVCGAKFAPSINPKTALLTVHFSGIDGPGRVLAWSDFPDGKGSPRIQRFDSEENWVISEHPEIHEIDILRVMSHELGHVLGVEHIACGNLMQPRYDPTIRYPQAGDIAEVVARYGLPGSDI